MILSNAECIEIGLYNIPIGFITTLKPQLISCLPIFSAKQEPSIKIRELWLIDLFGFIFTGVENCIVFDFIYKKTGEHDFLIRQKT
jgi:hypothetical protein